MSARRFHGWFWLLIMSLISTDALHSPGLTSSERRSTSQSGLIAIFGKDNATAGFHTDSASWKSNETTKDWGEWSPWSPWTPCTASCGLGVTKQTRQCVRKSSDFKRNVFYKRQRLKRVSDADAKCRGPANETRYHVCNKQLCPVQNTTDFRETQCSSFNEKLFNGQKYTWSAYYHAANLCALNCRAIGYRFYATLKPKVMDGTLCNNGTNDSTPHVCVEGQCKSNTIDNALIQKYKKPNASKPPNKDLYAWIALALITGRLMHQRGDAVKCQVATVIYEWQ